MALVDLNDNLPYCGRFAPSPTGPLHFGSLVAAVGSCLDARAHRGSWRVRMEDLDRPRCTQAAADEILRTLDCFGFEPDGSILWQSHRNDAYRAAFETLRASGAVYPCACTRAELADSRVGADGAVLYPGTCSRGLPPGKTARSWRLRIGEGTLCIDDRVQGRQAWDMASDCGDFVIRRADDLFAYQLAVVVDDAATGISDVVRGADILHSTPRQIAVQRYLGLPQIRYAHLPVVTNAAGEKLSKQTLARPLDCAQAGAELFSALCFLDQAPPSELRRAPPKDIWAWAFAHWDIARVRPGIGRPLATDRMVAGG